MSIFNASVIFDAFIYPPRGISILRYSTFTELRSFPESNTLRSFPRTCLCIRPPSKISNITCRSSCKRFARRNLAAYTFDPVAE
ncbi:hypothetical protein VN97_g5077 [Penicillium thymicola]|uniref:Uncharacterized protein n=1 Tax=Penicillium thymicola TaxID=293382 RepID=A0AAI9TJB1_PENTH|nr:hypothetical protein VN97_g5077 [Penicillium thymicola]